MILCVVGEEKKIVVVESPYAADSEEGIKKNVKYGRACMRDCFLKGEIPFASHLLFAQLGVLNDKDEKERELGLMSAFKMADKLNAEIVAIYEDLGISGGMKLGIEKAKRAGRKIEFRKLGDDWEEKHDSVMGSIHMNDSI